MLTREEQGVKPGESTRRRHVELAQSRAVILDFLGTTYLERPSAILAERLAEEDPGPVFLLAGDGGASARAIARECRGRDPVALHEELAVEHARLFLEPGPGYVAPYECIYIRGEADLPSMGPGAPRPVRLLWREATVAVEREYREAGAALVDRREPPDHVGLELQFLAFLCRAEADAWQAGDLAAAQMARRRQGDFLVDHLLRWVDEFCSALEDAARHPFYRGLARLTRAVVHADGEALVARSSLSGTQRGARSVRG